MNLNRYTHTSEPNHESLANQTSNLTHNIVTIDLHLWRKSRISKMKNIHVEQWVGLRQKQVVRRRMHKWRADRSVRMNELPAPRNIWDGIHTSTWPVLWPVQYR